MSSPNAMARKRRTSPSGREASAGGSAVATFHDRNQPALDEATAECEEVGLDPLYGLPVLGGERLGGGTNGRGLLKDVEHPRGGRIDAVVLPRVEVEDHRL